MCRIPRPSLPGSGDWFPSSKSSHGTPEREESARRRARSHRRDRRLWRRRDSGLDRLHFWERKFHLPELWETRLCTGRPKERSNRSGMSPSQYHPVKPRARLSFLKRFETRRQVPEELEQYRNLKGEHIQEILESPFESLFKIEEISFPIPPEAQIVESRICDYCGEPTKVDLLGDLDGRKACIPCREKFEFQQRHRKK